MKGYLGPGDKIELTAPGGGVTADVGYVIGGLFVVAEGTVAATFKFIGVKRGIVRLLKNTSEAITEGQKVFWDDSAKRVRNASATGRYLIGVAEKVQASSDTTCDVNLDAIAVTAVP